MDLDRLIRGVLKKTDVVPGEFEEAVCSAFRTLWPELEAQDLEVASFKRGVLHLLCESHARLAEVKAFHSEELRTHINQYLEQKRQQTAKRLAEQKKISRENPESRKEAHYVTRIQFHLTGTY